MPVEERVPVRSFMADTGVPPGVKNAVRKALGVLEKRERSSYAYVFRAPPEIKIEALRVEQDAEVPSWNYGVISLRVSGGEWSADARRHFEEKVIDAVYSKLSPREATKVLLDFAYV